ncbi:MAG: histidinol phosphate phosphatase domain-containing protein [Thermosulfidibacteraceae bacterium]|jgi:histidinol phosphatase-like PHP family hydrolase
MVDLHIHTLFSDGELLPVELVRRAKVNNLRYIALTDHIDHSNYKDVVPRIVEFTETIREVEREIIVIPGVEITHVPPRLIEDLTIKVRELGAKLVLLHGETIAEPVEKGTNIAGIKAKVDIIAHPGLISEEEVELAKEMGVYLEISGRKGHSLTNGHVAKLALKHGAKLSFGSDTHSPQDIPTPEFIERILLGAGIEVEKIKEILDDCVKTIEGRII